LKVKVIDPSTLIKALGQKWKLADIFLTVLEEGLEPRKESTVPDLFRELRWHLDYREEYHEDKKRFLERIDSSYRNYKLRFSLIFNVFYS